MTNSPTPDSISAEQLSIAQQLLESESYGAKAIATLEQQGTYANAFYFCELVVSISKKQ